MLAQDIDCFDLFDRSAGCSAVLLLLLDGFLPGCEDLGVGGCGVSLLLVGNLLEAIELLSIKFVEFGVDVYGN